MRVILSPFNISRPNDFLLFVLMWYSSASSSTKFIYSSKPTMWPSRRRFTFSYNQTCTRDLVCKYLKIRLIGCTITFCTFCGPLYAILLFFHFGRQLLTIILRTYLQMFDYLFSYRRLKMASPIHYQHINFSLKYVNIYLESNIRPHLYSCCTACNCD